MGSRAGVGRLAARRMDPAGGRPLTGSRSLLGCGRLSLGGVLAQKITFGFSLGQRVEGSKRTTTTNPPALAAAATLNIECRE